MAKRRRKRRRQGAIGNAPGTLEAPPDAQPTELRWMRFDEDRITEGEGLPDDGDARTTWIDVTGLADTETIRSIGERYGLHPLALEDALHVHQRPKADAFGEQSFVVTRMLRWKDGVEGEQVSFFVTGDVLISFQERPGDVFDPVRARLREGRGRIRRSGAPYLAYALLDALIDAVFPVLEHLGDRLELLDEAIFTEPSEETLKAVHEVKRELVTIRRAVWPLRELVSALVRSDHPLATEMLSPYLRDCYDHAVQLVDLVETHREHAASLLDVYLSTLGNRQNEVMKVLTMIATIFIPLSFLVGLYGMNFDASVSPYNMPELRYPYGYPILVAVMVTVVVAMVVYFRRRRWL